METQGHLIVDIARLDAEGESFSGETAADVLEMDATPLFKPVGGIAYDVNVEKIGEELLVQGQISHNFECACSRCAEVFTLNVADPAFFANYSVAEATDYVDLTPEMREAIILALPGYPVCREECKGLCARCGANLNHETCTCGPAQDGSWAALDQLVKR